MHLSVTMLWTTDEEIGSETSRAAIEACARESEAVLVLEPSLPGGAAKTSRKGCGDFELTRPRRLGACRPRPGQGGQRHPRAGAPDRRHRRAPGSGPRRHAERRPDLRRLAHERRRGPARTPASTCACRRWPMRRRSSSRSVRCVRAWHGRGSRLMAASPVRRSSADLASQRLYELAAGRRARPRSGPDGRRGRRRLGREFYGRARCSYVRRPRPSRRRGSRPPRTCRTGRSGVARRVSRALC